jgi:hypothetical protein
MPLKSLLHKPWEECKIMVVGATLNFSFRLGRIVKRDLPVLPDSKMLIPR